MCDGTCGARALTRRTFLAETMMAAVAAALTAACGDGVFGAGLSGGGPVNLSIDVNSFAALASVGGIARVDGNAGTPVAVYHSGVDTYRAFSMVCPHAGTTINIQGGGFRCPNHGATFTAAGVWTGGQKTTNLFELTTAYDPATGMLQITGNAPGGGGGGEEDDD
jgi:Rieske Fe-S protein